MCPAPSLNNAAPVLSTDYILGILQWCSISISNCIIELTHTESMKERPLERFTATWANSSWNPLAPFGRYQFTLVYIMCMLKCYSANPIQYVKSSHMKISAITNIGNNQYRSIGISAKMSYWLTLNEIKGEIYGCIICSVFLRWSSRVLFLSIYV